MNIIKELPTLYKNSKLKNKLLYWKMNITKDKDNKIYLETNDEEVDEIEFSNNVYLPIVKENEERESKKSRREEELPRDSGTASSSEGLGVPTPSRPLKRSAGEAEMKEEDEETN